MPQGQIAIICIFSVDTSSQSPEGLAEEVLDSLQSDGLPIVSARAWGQEKDSMQQPLAAAASFIGSSPVAPTSVGSEPTL